MGNLGLHFNKSLKYVPTLSGLHRTRLRAPLS